MCSAPEAFKFPIRVYIEDTDVGGIVFYANYLKYFERARTEFVRNLGFELRAGFNGGVSYVVHSLNLRYLQPATLDQVLDVTASIDKLGRTYMDFKQAVYDENGTCLVEGSVRVACVSLACGKPRALPTELKDVLVLAPR